MQIGKTVVVGGSGMVGRVLLETMGRHEIKPLNLVVAGRSSVGETIKTPVGDTVITGLELDLFRDAELVFMAAGAGVSREWIPQILGANNCSVIIDLSSAFRYDDNVPLVIPSINKRDMIGKRLIACPNCTTSIALMPLAPIHHAWSIQRVDLASYQAASGAGKQALDDLDAQTSYWAQNGLPPSSGSTGSTPYPLAGNLLARIDVAQAEWDGFTKEEMKTAWESRKILFKDTVPFYATCIRVPVRRCHSEVLTVQVDASPSVGEVRQLLSESFGVVVLDDVASHIYPMPLNMEGREEVGCGRIRVTPNGDILLWVCGDQLLRGAALTAVEIAEVLYS
ncbi:MAG: aspartate-semialdehyde dehydrogenase [Candidatus Buchananbacteria bacterium]|nr:aspartate-semialdehyde dehydrogenase [Candidatus Buchananbacteria bacterium]